MKLFHSVYLHIVFAVLFTLFWLAFIWINLDFAFNEHTLRIYDVELIAFILGFISYNSIALCQHISSLKNSQKNKQNLVNFYLSSSKFFVVLWIVLIGYALVKYSFDSVFLHHIYILVWALLSLIIWVKNKILSSFYIKNKRELPQVTQKKSYQIIAGYFAIIFCLLAFYLRPLSLETPEDYFPWAQLSSNEVVELLPDLQVSNGLTQLLINDEKSSQEKYSILVNNSDYISELTSLYNQYNTVIHLEDKNYRFNNYFLLNRVKTLYWEYLANNNQASKSVEIYQNIFENNHNLIRTNKNFITALVFSEAQETSLDSYINNKNLYTQQQNESIISHLENIDTTAVLKYSMANEMYAAHESISTLWEVPLVLDIDEMKKIDQYYKYIMIENQWVMNEEKLIQPSISRKNYLWTSFMQSAIFSFDQQYKKVKDLENKIAELKN